MPSKQKDKVLAKFTVVPASYDWEFDFVYRWEDVDDEATSAGIVWEDHLYINLPINEVGS